MKVLTLCTMGLVRSHAMKVAMMFRQHEVLNAGVEVVSSSTLDMLCDWADMILLAEGYMIERVSPKYHHKVVDIALGPDQWKSRVDKELIKATQKAISQALGANMRKPTPVDRLSLLKRLIVKHGGKE